MRCMNISVGARDERDDAHLDAPRALGGHLCPTSPWQRELQFGVVLLYARRREFAETRRQLLLELSIQHAKYEVALERAMSKDERKARATHRWLLNRGPAALHPLSCPSWPALAAVAAPREPTLDPSGPYPVHSGWPDSSRERARRPQRILEARAK